MKKKEIAELAVKELEKLYPDASCTLDYEKPYELMFAARLAAQCTDARVNIVTKTLFKKYPTLQAFADADLEELEQDVKPCGFYHTKAKSLKEMAGQLIKDFGGEVPDTMEKLLTLSGIGRKTANLMLGDVFGKPAMVTDTHCIRITGRLGLTKNKEPAKVEKDLVKLIPPEVSSDFCHRTVEFGRDICKARSPKCGECPLSYFCREYNERSSKEAKNNA
ncbi:MAG: endonuclease III [Ruminococcus sp.]|nr:endonuclease III [Ruminococcus sp.]